MQPAIDRDTLERLIALGRARGILTNRDIEEALPTDHMSAEDIALVVVHLEDAGIPVDLEESLQKLHPGIRSPDMGGAQILSFPERTSSPPPKSSRLETAQALPSAPSEEVSKTETFGMRSAHWAVLGSIFVLGLIGILVLILSR
jgi:hypothetical protein